MKFYSFFLLRLLCIFINLPYNHTWNTVVISELVLLAGIWNCEISYKNICRTVGPSLAAFLEPLAHLQNIASLSLFYRYDFGRCLSEQTQLFPFPYSQGKSTCYSESLHDFLSPFLDVTRTFPTVSFLTQQFSAYRTLSFDL